MMEHDHLNDSPALAFCFRRSRLRIASIAFPGMAAILFGHEQRNPVSSGNRLIAGLLTVGISICAFARDRRMRVPARNVRAQSQGVPILYRRA